MNDLLIVEDLVQMNTFLYVIDFVERAVIGKFAKRIVGKHSNTFRPFRYNSHMCYVSSMNALSEAYRWPSFDHIFWCNWKPGEAFDKLQGIK